MRFKPTNSTGLSLLEVMLAIAILGGSLVVIGELMRIGSRSAMTAREMSTAQMYCESKLAEIVAGIAPPESMGPAAFDTDPEWQYTIEANPSTHDGMLAIQVTVTQDRPARSRPISFTLSRWMLDPKRTPATNPNPAPTTSSSPSSSSNSSNSATSGSSGSSGSTSSGRSGGTSAGS